MWGHLYLARAHKNQHKPKQISRWKNPILSENQPTWKKSSKRMSLIKRTSNKMSSRYFTPKTIRLSDQTLIVMTQTRMLKTPCTSLSYLLMLLMPLPLRLYRLPILTYRLHSPPSIPKINLKRMKIPVFTKVIVESPIIMKSCYK